MNEKEKKTQRVGGVVNCGLGFCAGCRGSAEETRFYSVIGLHNGSSICGFPGPGSQGGAEAPVEGFVGRAAPLAQPFCPQIKDC